jgi:hypothetical protein
MSEDLVQALGKFHLYHLILIIAPFVTVIFSLMSMKDFTLYFAQSPRSALILAFTKWMSCAKSFDADTHSVFP